MTTPGTAERDAIGLNRHRVPDCCFSRIFLGVGSRVGARGPAVSDRAPGASTALKIKPANKSRAVR